MKFIKLAGALVALSLFTAPAARAALVDLELLQPSADNDVVLLNWDVNGTFTAVDGVVSISGTPTTVVTGGTVTPAAFANSSFTAGDSPFGGGLLTIDFDIADVAAGALRVSGNLYRGMSEVLDSSPDGGVLLEASMLDVGFVNGTSTDIFNFLFTITGGSLVTAGLLDSGTVIGMIMESSESTLSSLDANSNGTGSAKGRAAALAVSEPGIMALAGVALVALVGLRRRRAV